MVYDKPLDFRNMKSDVKKAWNGGIPVIITPEMAVYWLRISEGKNVRPIKERTVTQYTSDLMTGRLTTRTVRFHKDGWCADGQHLFTSIVRSGMSSQPTFVELGYVQSEIGHFDISGLRSIAISTSSGGYSISESEAALAVTLEYGLFAYGTSLTRDEKIDLVKKYRIPIDFVINNLKTQKKPNAMKHAIAKVYMKIKDNPKKVSRLIEFMKVYSTKKDSGPGDRAALNLREVLLTVSSADKNTRLEIFMWTISTIESFFNKSQAARICFTSRQKQLAESIKKQSPFK